MSEEEERAQDRLRKLGEEERYTLRNGEQQTSF